MWAEARCMVWARITAQFSPFGSTRNPNFPDSRSPSSAIESVGGVRHHPDRRKPSTSAESTTTPQTDQSPSTALRIRAVLLAVYSTKTKARNGKPVTICIPDLDCYYRQIFLDAELVKTDGFWNEILVEDVEIESVRERVKDFVIEEHNSTNGGEKLHKFLCHAMGITAAGCCKYFSGVESRDSNTGSCLTRKSVELKSVYLCWLQISVFSKTFRIKSDINSEAPDISRYLELFE
ncbi:hypothetical protein STAS_22728 [Striga asiatica]|uniref:Uncharacterized protein n=1 Tax=Striga asiatica TaxID=4170 RepID=A0A5A7QLL0_STRAF|nr:hypothetical protein STAS_22728 [Striga asiatica]